MKRILILSIILLGGYLLSAAQETYTRIDIGFRVGKTNIETSFCDNAENLAKILKSIQEAQNDSSLEIVNIAFRSTASPEGSFGRNKVIAQGRLEAIEKYIRDRVEIPDSLITKREGVIAWEELAGYVEKDTKLRHKDEALHILTEVPEYTYGENGQLLDSRKKHLMDMQYGRTWHYLAKHYFAKIRRACTIILTTKKVEKPVVVEEVVEEVEEIDTVVPVEPDTVAVVAPAPVEPEPTDSLSPFYMAVKTNMLYDAGIVPNIGVEFYLGKEWSIAANWMYAWWKTDKRHWWWRTYGGDFAVRKWLGKAAKEKPLTGHHLGVYGQMITYDFEVGQKGYLADKWSYGAGIEYGFALPIAKRLNIDFTLGLGYLGGKYKEYIPIDNCYVWQATKNRHWFGPTKLEISLVWLIGRGNCNAEKGGMK